MERKKFLRSSLGLIGIGSILAEACTKQSAASELISSADAENVAAACITTPQETPGPYELDLIQNSAIFRSDITEGKTGIPLNLKLRIVNANDNCTPIQGARVDLWHCDKDGYYSGFKEPGYLGDMDLTGQTFLRGIQLSDANGFVVFNTIYPGWYSGRITHIHLEVFFNSFSKKTTQIAFPDKLNPKVYSTSLYTGHGANTSVRNNVSDLVFKDSINDELVTIVSASEAGIAAKFTVGVPL